MIHSVLKMHQIFMTILLHFQCEIAHLFFPKKRLVGGESVDNNTKLSGFLYIE